MVRTLPSLSLNHAPLPTGRAGREEQEAVVRVRAVEQRVGWLRDRHESELVGIPGPGAFKVGGRDRREHVLSSERQFITSSAV
jgi:hypothetical protein